MTELMYFYAKWHRPCVDILQNLRFIESIICHRFEINDKREIAEKFKIKLLPTFILINDHNVIDIKSGVLSIKVIQAWIRSKVIVQRLE